MFDAGLLIDEKTQVVLNEKKVGKSVVIDMLGTAQ
jgi:hypothetical protein